MQNISSSEKKKIQRESLNYQRSILARGGTVPILDKIVDFWLYTCKTIIILSLIPFLFPTLGVIVDLPLL